MAASYSSSHYSDCHNTTREQVEICGRSRLVHLSTRYMRCRKRGNHPKQTNLLSVLLGIFLNNPHLFPHSMSLARIISLITSSKYFDLFAAHVYSYVTNAIILHDFYFAKNIRVFMKIIIFPLHYTYFRAF